MTTLLKNGLVRKVTLGAGALIISTMTLAMETAAEHGLRFVVLDRPNPINGRDVEGPVLQATIRYGLLITALIGLSTMLAAMLFG